MWAIGAAVTQVLYTHKVSGSNPLSPTIEILARALLALISGLFAVSIVHPSIRTDVAENPIRLEISQTYLEEADVISVPAVLA